MAELTITVTRGAVQLLQNCLMRPGWAKDPVTLYRAGAISESISAAFAADPMPQLPPQDPKEPPKQEALVAHAATLEAWATKSATMPISAKDYEICKACITAAVSVGNLIPTKHYMSLAEALGLAGK